MPAKKIQYERPPLYDKQERAIFNDARYAVVEASTKSGKTVGCIAWIVEQAVKNGGPNKNFWWVAPVSTQADIAFRRTKHAIPDAHFETNESEKIIKLVNGAWIWFKSADKPDSLYGEDVYAAVIDEASRCKEESWNAVRSTITATQAPVRVIGNVKGKKNWAYKLARQAEQSNKDRFHYEKITAIDAVEAGVLDEQEVLDAKEMLPESVFQELYMAEPADDGGNPFGIDHIQQCIRRDEDGNKISSTFDSKPIAWGWDVAKSVNYTVGIGLDKNGNVCRFHRWRDDWETTIRKIIEYTGSQYALVDSTGSGDNVVERLKRDGGANFDGYKFTSRSKQDIMVGLAVAIQNGEITYPAGRIVDELESFEYEQRPNYVMYSAPEGANDDCVDALALAVAKLNQRQKFPMSAAPKNYDKASYWSKV